MQRIVVHVKENISQWRWNIYDQKRNHKLRQKLLESDLRLVKTHTGLLTNPIK